MSMVLKVKKTKAKVAVVKIVTVNKAQNSHNK